MAFLLCIWCVVMIVLRGNNGHDVALICCLCFCILGFAIYIVFTDNDW